MKYILDTNVYISAHLGYYGLDICPSYWDILRALGANGTVFSPKEVREEILAKDDDLARWAGSQNKCFHSRDLPKIIEIFHEVNTIYKELKVEKKIEFGKKITGYKLPRRESVSDEDMMVVGNCYLFSKKFSRSTSNRCNQRNKSEPAK